jgi:hypothetical protein
VEKYCTAGQATDDNMVHELCMLERKLRIRNTYWFFTATMVARKRLNVTLHVHFLSCWSFLTASTAPNTVKDNLFSQNLLQNLDSSV